MILPAEWRTDSHGSHGRVEAWRLAGQEALARSQCSGWWDSGSGWGSGSEEKWWAPGWISEAVLTWFASGLAMGEGRMNPGLSPWRWIDGCAISLDGGDWGGALLLEEASGEGRDNEFLMQSVWDIGVHQQGLSGRQRHACIWSSENRLEIWHLF